MSELSRKTTYDLNNSDGVDVDDATPVKLSEINNREGNLEKE